jgi:hypothetical protein
VPFTPFGELIAACSIKRITSVETGVEVTLDVELHADKIKTDSKIKYFIANASLLI